MIRCEHWERKMYEIIEDKKYQTFQWGTSDCLLFTADVVHALTGEDFAKDIRGKYDTLESAYQMLKEFSGGGVIEAIEKLAVDRNGLEVPVPRAQRGDVVIIETLLGDTLAVCIGEKVITVGPSGLVQLPLLDAKRAWKI